MALNVVFYDVETTGFGNDVGIVQLAAKWQDRVYSCYVMPHTPIHRRASAIHHITLSNGRLYLRGQEINEVLSADEAMRGFLQFLFSIGSRALLVAHNGLVYDHIHLVNTIARCNLTSEYKNVVSGFADTLRIFRSIYPGRQRYNLKVLAEDILNMQVIEDAHNAVVDVDILQMLANEIVTTQAVFEANSVNFEVIEAKIQMRQDVSNLSYFKKCLRTDGEIRGVTPEMIRKMAVHGITLDDMLVTFEEHGEPGLRDLLTPVTRQDRIVSELIALTVMYVGNNIQTVFTNNLQ